MTTIRSLWFTECNMCPNLDRTFYMCNKACFKPKAENGVCKIFLKTPKKELDKD